MSAGDSARGENAPGTVRRIGFGAANVTLESVDRLSTSGSWGVELLEAVLELEDLGAGSAEESGCLDEVVFLMNLPDESLGWAFEDEAFDDLDIKLVTKGDHEVNVSRN